MKNNQSEIIRVGVSLCLLGEKVRFDAGHKKDRYITDILGKYFQWFPVCPEAEVGMGIPREPVRLEGSPDDPQMVGVKSKRDWTETMNQYSQVRVRELSNENLSGFIVKSDSPSCGMERVKVYAKTGIPAKNGRGLFTGKLLDEQPLLPVEEEGRLNDDGIRENFIIRVFAYHRLQQLIANGFHRGDLVAFHTSHKYLLLSHSPKHYALLGKLVGSAKTISASELRHQYSSLFMEALKVKATVKKNVNVLQHILGFLREKLASDEKKDIAQVIQDYYDELVPLIVPITLLRHYVFKHNIEYIRDQIYMNPHPKELMLRNHI